MEREKKMGFTRCSACHTLNRYLRDLAVLSNGEGNSGLHGRTGLTPLWPRKLWVASEQESVF